MSNSPGGKSDSRLVPRVLQKQKAKNGKYEVRSEQARTLGENHGARSSSDSQPTEGSEPVKGAGSYGPQAAATQAQPGKVPQTMKKRRMKPRREGVSADVEMLQSSEAI